MCHTHTHIHTHLSHIAETHARSTNSAHDSQRAAAAVHETTFHYGIEKEGRERGRANHIWYVPCFCIKYTHVALMHAIFNVQNFSWKIIHQIEKRQFCDDDGGSGGGGNRVLKIILQTILCILCDAHRQQCFRGGGSEFSFCFSCTHKII